MPLLPLCALAVLPAQEGPPSHFRNVAAEVGLEELEATDVIWVDFDGDGWLDVCANDRDLYRSSAGQSFAPLEEGGLPNPTIERVQLDGAGNLDESTRREIAYAPEYVHFADLDNDGRADAVWGVRCWWEALRANRWVKVEEADPGLRSAILLGGEDGFGSAPASDFSSDEALGPAKAVSAVDFDRDGILDLWEGREYRQYGQLYGCGVDRLWKGDGAGGFVDVTESVGLLTVPQPAGERSSRPSYGVTTADVDGNGWPDLLSMSYGRQWNYLWLADGEGGFVEHGLRSGFAGDAITHGRYPSWVGRSPEQPFRSNGNTFDCAVGDIDGDLDLDLFLGEIAHAWAGFQCPHDFA